jgi:hypothetical protein
MPIVNSDGENWHPKNRMRHGKENQMRRRNPNFPLYTAGTLVASVILAAANPLFGMPANAPENLPPAELVRLTVAHEVAAAEHASVKHRFRSRRETGHGSQTKIYVETRDAMLGMVVAYNDQPASPEQMQAEKSRLQRLIKDPDQLRRRQKQEKEDTEHTLRIVRALPDAFLYEYEGTQDGMGDVGRIGDKLLRLKFRPNPTYAPPSHVEQVLTGMQGELLIDAQCHRIARIDGTLFKEVGFGWDILGHLDKGGHFMVQQAEVADGTWDVTRMVLNFTGKILLLKSLNIKTDEVFSDFWRVPESMTIAQGVELLESQDVRSAQAQNDKTETAERR